MSPNRTVKSPQKASKRNLQTRKRVAMPTQPLRRWALRLLLAGFFAILLLAGWSALARHFAPQSNTDLTRFDTLIVLGYPADYDGNPSPLQLARVNEAVREYERGVAPHILMTGGAAHNHFVEAEVMARTAESEGVPASAIIIEGKALDTIQNACYSVRLMREHGWKSAEVVSTAAHLPRAAMIFEPLPIEWRMHAAPPLTPDFVTRWKIDEKVEVIKTMRFLVWARLTERCEP